jgi:hypothetical protein
LEPACIKDESDMEERVFGLSRLVAMRYDDDASTLLLSLTRSSMPFIVQINRRSLVDWKLLSRLLTMHALANIDAKPNETRATGTILTLLSSGLIAANNAVAPAGLAYGAGESGGYHNDMETRNE